MSEDTDALENESAPPPPSIRKIRLKIPPAQDPISNAVPFPSDSFSPERQELDDDPEADREDSALPSPDPRRSLTPPGTVPQYAALDDSSSLPDLPFSPQPAKASASVPALTPRLTRSRCRTDSTPLPPPSTIQKRPRSDSSESETGSIKETGNRKPRKRRSGGKVTTPQPVKTAPKDATKAKKPRKRTRKSKLEGDEVDNGASQAPPVRQSQNKGKSRGRSPPPEPTELVTESPVAPSSQRQLTLAIDIEVMETIAVRQRKGREKDKIIKFDAFEADASTVWSDILVKIAAKLRTEVGCLRLDTFTWRPSQPKNAEERSLNSEDAWKVCVKRVLLKPKSPFIVIRMAPPNPAPTQPSWTQPSEATATSAAVASIPTVVSTCPETATATAAAIDENHGSTPLPPSLGATDAILIPIIQKLQALYPKGSCKEHPDRFCFFHQPTQRHFAIEGLAAKSWATKIHHQQADFYRLPVSPHFHPSKALPTPRAPPNGGNAPPEPGPSMTPATPSFPAGISAPSGHPFFMTPFPSFNPFSPYGLPPHFAQSHLGPSPFSPFPQSTPSAFPTGPLSSPPRGMTLKDWCGNYKLDDKQYEGLAKLGFKIGMLLDSVPEEEWKDAGFTRLTWNQAVSAASTYRAERAQSRKSQ